MADPAFAPSGGEEFSYESSSVGENSSYEEFSVMAEVRHG